MKLENEAVGEKDRESECVSKKHFLILMPCCKFYNNHYDLMGLSHQIRFA